MALPFRRPNTPPDASAPVPAQRGRRIARTLVATGVCPILRGGAIVLVLALTPWGKERVRSLLVSQANKRMNGELAIGSLRGNLLSGATLTDVRLADSARRPLFSARRVRFRYALGPALRGRLVLRSLVLDTPTVLLDKQPGARWNFQSLLRPSGAPRDTAQRRVPPELADITIITAASSIAARGARTRRSLPTSATRRSRRRSAGSHGAEWSGCPAGSSAWWSTATSTRAFRRSGSRTTGGRRRWRSRRCR
jgi:hypothetical protein